MQLGYGKEGNSPADDELIKWHADELYQEQRREKEAKNSANEVAK